MKKLIFLVFTSLIFFTSCEDFLDTQNLTKKDSGNFPVNETDASQLVTSVYSTLNSVMNAPNTSYFYVAEVASDDRFGGDGEDGKDARAIDHLMYANINYFSPFWSERYKGISRANMAIANMDNIADEETRNQKLGEALFLRAFSYFELTQMFGDIPFIESAPENVEEAQESPKQIPAKDVYKYIASDLKKAYDIMPSYKWDEVISGTVTKWAAAGLMARVYLFYTGFFDETSIPLTDGETLTKAQVVAALEDCINHSGHKLVDDYRQLWGYSNSLTKKDYDYVSDLEGSWIKDGENPEQVFAIKCAYLGTWQNAIGYSNQYCLFFGIRSSGDSEQYKNTFPFGQGWGQGPVNPGLWNEWEDDAPNDPRRKASILNVEEEFESYDYYGADKQMEESGFWQKKYIATTAYKNDDELYNSFTSAPEYYGDGENDHYQVSHSVDLTIIRYADILLMHSELTETADGINEVRRRVDLPEVPYSLENLKKERRYELAFEGVRWLDIRRWGDAPDLLSNQLGQPIYNKGIETEMKDQGAGYVQRYNATKGYMPIPQSEIELSNGSIKQTEGWDNSALFTSWSN